MTMCNNGHEEIVHDGFNCPFCDYLDRAASELNDLHSKVDSLTDEVSELTGIIQYRCPEELL